MSQTALHVPAFVNYDCRMCGWCCRQYELVFSAEEHAGLARRDWGALASLPAGKAWCSPVKGRGSGGSYRLRYGPAGGCIFLSPGNKCLMHAHVGELGKIIACGVFPFTFLATPTGVYVGCRFGCPAVAGGLGRPLTDRQDSLRKQLGLVREAGALPRGDEAVVFSGKRTLSWQDYLCLEGALLRLLLREDVPLVRRVFAVHKFVDTLSVMKPGRVRGPQFKELVELLEQGLLGEALGETLPGKADGLRRALFRQHCFVFQRRHGGSYHELGASAKLRVRLGNFWRSMQFAFGVGSPSLPEFPGRFSVAGVAGVKVHAFGPEDDLAVSRYLAAKVFGKQYFGRLFFGYSLRQGLVFLLLSAGAVMWYARAHALVFGRTTTKHEDIIEAIRYVDYCYGSSPVPGLFFQRLCTRIMGFDDSYARAALAQFV